MTIFHMDGFETYGIKTTSAANLETRISATTRTNFQEVSGGHTDDIEIIDDEATGAPTCEDGEFLPFIELVASCLAVAVQRFRQDGRKVGFSISPTAVQRI